MLIGTKCDIDPSSIFVLVCCLYLQYCFLDDLGGFEVVLITASGEKYYKIINNTFVNMAG